MGQLGNKKLTLIETETTPGVDAIEPVLQSATGVLKKIFLDSWSVDPTYDVTQTGGDSPTGGTGPSTVALRNAVVAGEFPVSCWDPVTFRPAWLPIALASGFEVEVDDAVGGSEVTTLTYTGVSTPFTTYVYEKFLDGTEQLRCALGVCGKLDFNWAPGESLKGVFTAGLGTYGGEPTGSADYLDPGDNPILLKDGVTAVDPGFSIECPEKNLKACGITHEFGGLSYPINTGSIVTSGAQQVIETVASTSDPIVAEVCCYRDGDITGQFDLLTLDGCAALADYRTKFAVSDTDTYQVVFMSPDCKITFDFADVQLLPYTRNIGDKITWGIPWKTVDTCGVATPDFRIIIENNP